MRCRIEFQEDSSVLFTDLKTKPLIGESVLILRNSKVIRCKVVSVDNYSAFLNLTKNINFGIFVEIIREYGEDMELEEII